MILVFYRSDKGLAKRAPREAFMRLFIPRRAPASAQALSPAFSRSPRSPCRRWRRPRSQIGCTATSDCASAMVAVDQGMFAKHGLDAKMMLIGINSNIPAAIVSNSIQIGGPTESVFLQAVDGGLDLVAVEGASRMDPISNQADRRLRAQRDVAERGQGFRRQESRRAGHRRLPASAVRQMAGGKRRRSEIGEFRRSHLPDA